jgi:Trypsin-like peptidase domain
MCVMMVKMLCFLPFALFAGADALAQAPLAVQKAVCDATIAIKCSETRQASGIVLGTKDSRAYALTAQHVIANAKQEDVKAIARISGTAETFSRVEFIWSDEQSDLALISFIRGESKFASVKLGECTRKTEDFPVLKTSWRSGANPVFQEDQAIKRILRKGPKGNAFFWQTKGTNEEGNSGGGMFSEKGELLGICSGNQQGFGYFVHRDEIFTALKKDARSSFLVAQDGKD